eukprot:TRINITY_DN23988_c0_g1_i1.p1 TRINITY_DN23988_c0_g1~~TRINITY_DN23988_c0_g1_i1.p1  ORF type:complete len:128 (-),score=13.04 TRINITY_DN23988_c0_g1_i1:1-384(-)
MKFFKDLPSSQYIHVATVNSQRNQHDILQFNFVIYNHRFFFNSADRNDHWDLCEWRNGSKAAFVTDHSNAHVLCVDLSLIHISEPTRPLYISYAVFCLKKKKTKYNKSITSSPPKYNLNPMNRNTQN